ncbi:hypothetical protein KCU88_g6493, partial [Aureobasidium melanogenum]
MPNMFFIVPDCKVPSGGSPPSPGASSLQPEAQKRQRLSAESDEVAGYYPKRNQKACDRVEDLKRLPGPTTSREELADFGDIDLHRNAAEIQALLDEWNIPITQAGASISFEASTQNVSTQPTQALVQDSTTLLGDTSFLNIPTISSAGVPDGQLGPRIVPPAVNEFDDWLVADEFEDNWASLGPGEPNG